MELENNSGDFVRLKLTGYQFPDDEHDEYDSNWVVVHVHAGLNGRVWERSDACLLTWEVEWLASWLEGLALQQNVETVADFLEPNLRFERIAEAAFAVRVWF